MPTVTEKGIRLDFPAGWAVVKYDGDTHSPNASFYRQRIESKVQNVRGVDVVSQTPGPEERLLLIEIKDYRVSAQPAERNVSALRQTVVQKALNTLSGLYAAARTRDPELQAVAAGLFQPGLRIEVVLFLERPPLPVAPVSVAQKLRRQNPSSALENLDLDLTSTLAALGMDFQLRSTAAMRPADGWSGRG
ncbi:MAG: hypothetical protein M3Y54_15055 [Bacteroidota bacterium]|nr:hypothetical protein [Bacteroidota bacterium]